MLPYLTNQCPFPDINQALKEPDGLLAAGANLSVPRLLNAYSNGIFPWYSEGEPILWWSPNPRTIFDTQHYNPPKSLCRFVRKSDWQITLNNAFEEVIEACAEPREDSQGTWITDEIIDAYITMHKEGHAHSIEVWQNEKLIGGIYGVSIGKLFCGESMFSKESQASKIALSCLIGYIKQYDFPILDAQIKNPHLTSLGATQINRSDFISTVHQQIKIMPPAEIWQAKNLSMKKLVTRI